MNSTKTSTFIMIALLASISTLAQHKPYNWIFIKEQDNITIHYRESDTLHYEELKFTTYFKTTPSKMVSIIADIEKMPEWSFLCVETRMLKWVSPQEWYYYYVTDTPWPLDDRDVVLHILVSTDSISGVTTINTRNFNGLLPEQDGFVRVPKQRSRWVFTPIKENYTRIDFYFATDPGGIIPTWLVNSTISYAPNKALNTLKAMVETED